MTGEHAAIAVGEPDLGIGDLACACIATELADDLDDAEETVHAGMNAGKPAAVRVHRKRAARGDPPAFYETSAFTFGTEAESSRKRIVLMVKAS